MDIMEKSLQKHEEWQGKIEIISRAPIRNREDLSLAYTPGVARPCLEIQKDENKSFELTRRANIVAVVTDGTAVLGLGDIGPSAAMPVMEGKCALFKEFGEVDAFPICIDSKDVDEIVRTVFLISKSFGGINLEDIAAPRCFEIEKRLKECCDIPVFHDDQHGTAIIVAAALLNAMKLTKREMGTAHIVVNGAGAAGIAITRLLLQMNFGDIVLCDKQGAIYRGAEWTNPAQKEMAELTNRENKQGSLSDMLKGADVFIGVSAPNIVSSEMIASMAEHSIVFPMANPVPEIMPDEAKKGGSYIIGTRRSDFPNQINNVMAFPGIFKGVLRVRARDISESMKRAAAYAIAGIVEEEELSPDYILPDPFNEKVANAVADAVAKDAVEHGLARVKE